MSEAIEVQIEDARKALRSFSASAFNKAFGKPVVSGLWKSIFKKEDKRDGKQLKKDELVRDLLQWVSRLKHHGFIFASDCP